MEDPLTYLLSQEPEKLKVSTTFINGLWSMRKMFVGSIYLVKNISLEYLNKPYKGTVYFIKERNEIRCFFLSNDRSKVLRLLSTPNLFRIEVEELGIVPIINLYLKESNVTSENKEKETITEK
jgi:hypothetical protein